MKQIRTGSALVLLLLAAEASVLAETQSDQQRGDALLRADTDSNGQLSAAEWTALFTTLDANGDGELSADEALPPPRPRFLPKFPDELLAHLIARGADEDGDGVVSELEWTTRVQTIDKNGDGAVEADELPGPPQARNSKRLAELLGRWDANKNDKLDADELGELFRKADRDQDGTLSPSDGWPLPERP